MKYIYRIMVILFLLLVICFYYQNAGWTTYKIRKMTNSPLDLIRYYSNKPFGDLTKIEKIEFGEDSNMFDEYMRATLLVPSEELDTLFLEDKRHYDKNVTYIACDKENMYFSCEEFLTVRRPNERTQRSIEYVVLMPKDGYAEIYFSVDKLGWILRERPLRQDTVQR